MQPWGDGSPCLAPRQAAPGTASASGHTHFNKAQQTMMYNNASFCYPEVFIEAAVQCTLRCRTENFSQAVVVKCDLT
ncbi:hypothetical protein E2C01_082564 [Portunus trituberculatus]|uniref:Uncharacterized protein n=1 Tax=Portunus trituberculatus TaxID=210409 RepID=A0A5B7IUX4_PORTR|nr:hypothetical protein [Portunus trituberculatus]